MSNTALQITEKQIKVAESIDNIVADVAKYITAPTFQRTFVRAQALSQIESLLTSEYMIPIMNLQGKSIGFKTDKDREGGYSEEAVKRCLVQAALEGLEPIGNQFNIISGNVYPTKNGATHLLKKISGLVYKWKPNPPNINNQEGKANVDGVISWYFKNSPTEVKEEKLDFPIKINNGTTSDNLLGKAERKAKVWLYNYITDNSLVDGDVSDMEPVYQTPKKQPNRTENTEHEEAQIVEEEAIVEQPTIVREEAKYTEEQLKSVYSYLDKSKNKEDFEKRKAEILKQPKYKDFNFELYTGVATKF